MSIEAEVAARLRGLQALTAIVGPDGIEPDAPDESTPIPCVFYEIDRLAENDITGTGGLWFGDLVVTCRAWTRETATAIRNAVQEGLGPYGSNAFDSWLTAETPANVSADDGSGRSYRDWIMTFGISWNE